MQQLKLRDDPESMNRLSKASSAVEDFWESHPSELTEEERGKLGDLLKARALALSEATGVKIYSICDQEVFELMWMEEGIYHVLESTNQSGSKMTAALASCGNGRMGDGILKLMACSEKTGILFLGQVHC